MNENANKTNEEQPQQRKPKTPPRIIGDFTEVMKAEAASELSGKLFAIEAEPDVVANILKRECFISAATDTAALNAFVRLLPIRLVMVKKKSRENRTKEVLAEWKDSLTQVGRNIQPPEGE